MAVSAFTMRGLDFIHSAPAQKVDWILDILNRLAANFTVHHFRSPSFDMTK
jgi:hypothetical protein